MPPGSTVEVDKAPEDDEKDVTITIVKPKERNRETVGVGAQGDAREEGSSTDPAGEDAPGYPRPSCRTSRRSCRTCRTLRPPKRTSPSLSAAG